MPIRLPVTENWISIIELCLPEIVLSHDGEQKRLAGAQLRAHIERRWVEAGIGKVSLKARELSHMGSMALVSAETSIDLLGIRHGEHTQLTAGSKFVNRCLFSQLHFSDAEASHRAEK